MSNWPGLHCENLTDVSFLTVRKAIDVGVHREARYRWQASPLEDQLRKRAFHTLYSLDRSISAMMGRPVSITDEDIDLEYP